MEDEKREENEKFIRIRVDLRVNLSNERKLRIVDHSMIEKKDVNVTHQNYSVNTYT